MRRVAIVASSRIPFARSFGAYMGVNIQTLMGSAVESLVQKTKLSGVTLGEVALGAVLKHSSDWNFAREVVLSTSLAPQTPGYDIVQACGTSLEAAIAVANKIAVGQIDCGIAGGVDTNSDLPFVFGNHFNHVMLEAGRAKTFGQRLKAFMKLKPSDFKPHSPMVVEPRTGLTMGQSCELMAKTWKVTRTEQDELAYMSHQNAVKAYKDGFYSDLVVPYGGLDKDQNPRGDTSMEKLGKLKPVFDPSPTGTLTAGNSSPLSDGAAAVLLATEEWAKARGLPVLAYLKDAQVAAVDFVKAEGLLMAPAYAVARLLERNQMKLQDFDLYEIHEAFAAQVLCTLKAWESPEYCRERLGASEALGAIDRGKMNLQGGSVALGHPFAATGARILGGLAKALHTRGSGKGLISICTGGGMGVTALVEK